MIVFVCLFHKLGTTHLILNKYCARCLGPPLVALGDMFCISGIADSIILPINGQAKATCVMRCLHEAIVGTIVGAIVGAIDLCDDCARVNT